MAIKVNIRPTQDSLVGQSHWWGFPDLPESVDWPANNDGDLLTFICQIRMDEIAQFDPEGLLPHEGMMWVFADMDYFLGDMDARCNGIGEWQRDSYKVIYQKEVDELHTHEYYWEDGSPTVLPAEAIDFEKTDESEYGLKLLGMPSMTEGYENENEGLLSLLQIDEEEGWNLRFFDCGMINFMIPTAALVIRDFEQVSLKLQSL